MWQKQIQTIEYGLDDTIRIKKKGVTYTDTLLIYTLWCEFSNDSDAQSDFGKNFVKKKAGPLKPFLSKIEYLAVAFIESDTVYILW